jgi:cytochrome c oxidase cbb3-type subunit 3
MGEFSMIARRMGRAGACIIAALLGVLAIYAQTSGHIIEKSERSTQALASGKRTFESSCAPCHGLNGKGAERAPDIATRSEIVKLSDTATLTVLRDGVPARGMPSFAELGSKRLRDLLSYLRALQSKGQVSVSAANGEKGREVFAGKGGCSQCHMVEGAGGFLGPDLSDYAESHSAGDIRNAIVSADKRPAARKELANATTKDGRRISGLVRNEDNFSVQLQALDGTFHSLEKSDLSELTFDSAPFMPSDYDSRLSQSDLDQLVAYLLSIRNAKR